VLFSCFQSASRFISSFSEHQISVLSCNFVHVFVYLNSERVKSFTSIPLNICLLTCLSDERQIVFSVFNYYFSCSLPVFTILIICGIILLPVLLPIAITGGAGKKLTTSKGTFNELDQLSMGNITVRSVFLTIFV